MRLRRSVDLGFGIMFRGIIGASHGTVLVSVDLPIPQYLPVWYLYAMPLR